MLRLLNFKVILFIITASLGGVCLPSCITAQTPPCSDQTREVIMSASSQAHQFKDKQSVYFVLKNGTMCSSDEPTPKTFYVVGHIEDGRFMADSDVKGDGELGQSGRPGWLEIPTGQFYSQETPRAVMSPYVNGYMTDAGFVPSSTRVR
jgi:hypothetical protein